MASIDDVQDISPRIQYTAAAAQVAFDYPFPIFADADLVVDVDGVVQTLTTNYTVSGAGDDNGGTVTFVSAPGDGTVVTIYRDISIARSTDVQQNGPFSSTSWNDEQDKVFLILQELENKIGRAVRFPQTAAITNAQAEINVSNFLSKFLFINSSGILTAAAALDNTVSLTAEVIGALMNPETAAETTVGATIVTFAREEGDVLRYATNTTPGTTDMTTATQTAVDVMEENDGGDVLLDRWMLISSTITIDDHAVRLKGRASATRNTGAATGCRLDYSGSGIALTIDGAHGVRVEGIRLTNTGTGTVGLNFVDSQNCTFDQFHVREFSADNWLWGCTTAASCIYNKVTNCSGFTTGATANGIRMYEGAGKATNNNQFDVCNFGNNAVGIHQDDECHENVFMTVELGSCTKAAELRGRTFITGIVENCTTGIELVSGSAAVLDGMISLQSNTTNIVNTGDRPIFATLWNGGFGATASAAQIADVASTLNTTAKFWGRFIWDTTNKRLLRSSGDAAADDWEVVDGSAQVTPS